MAVNQIVCSRPELGYFTISFVDEKSSNAKSTEECAVYTELHYLVENDDCK